MNSIGFRSLWGVAPVATTNLIKSGIVSTDANGTLADAAVRGFDQYLETHRASSPPSSAAAGRRRKRQRPSSASPLADSKPTAQHPQTTKYQGIAVTGANHTAGDVVTNNDYFFEYQRIRGYRMALSQLAQSDSAMQLEQNVLPLLCATYLHHVGTQRSKQVAGMMYPHAFRSDGDGQQDGISPPQQQHASTQYGFESTLSRVLSSAGDDPDDRTYDNASSMLDICMWAAIQRGAGAYHGDHVHTDALVSGVYYARVPEGSAPLVFRRPQRLTDTAWRERCNHDESLQYINEDGDVAMHPQEGQVVLFPSWLLHGVPMVQHESLTRVSFAFNLQATGIGSTANSIIPGTDIDDPWSVTQLDV